MCILILLLIIGRTMCTDHVRGDFLGSVSIQIKFKSHHFVVVGLQLTLNHFISSVTHLCVQRGMTCIIRLKT